MSNDVDANELLLQIRSGRAPFVLDVRSRAEFDTGHVPRIESTYPSGQFRGVRAELRVGADHPIVVYCGHGPRALFARAALRRRGFTRVACLAGHMAKWREAGHRLER